MTVSVAMCTFRGAPFVRQQLDSIAAQSSPPDELVVADDGSDDGTLDLVRAFAARAPFPVRILEPEAAPLGVTANFERAIRATTGSIVVLSDQDDVWAPERIAAAAAALGDRGALLVHGDARLVDAEGVPQGGTLLAAFEAEADLALVERGEAFPAFLRRNLATGATVAFRRELLDDALPFPREWVHDEWLAILAAARGGVRLERRALVDYRQHGANEIGAAAPTLRYKIARVIEPGGAERTAGLAVRSRLLADRLRQVGTDDGIVRAAEEKAAFEAGRAGLPRLRVARIAGVLRGFRGGGYGRFASRGRLDVLRDLLGAPAPRA